MSLEQIALRGTWLDQEDVGRLLELSLPGIDELAALLEIARARRSRRFDLIVVDTAPTGHTLRMLTMPEMLGGLARVFDLMQQKHRVMVAALTGAYAPDGSDALIEEIAREASSLAALVRDPRTCRMSWVTLPELMAVEETADASDTLSAAGIPLADVIVNRVTPPPSAPCGWCDGRRMIERQAIGRLRARLRGTPTMQVTARPREPRGVAALRKIGMEIAHARAVRSPSVPAGRRRVWRADAGQERCGIDMFAGPETRLVLFGGKGGVGKTTCAAAAALALAARSPSRSVLLLSTDPAHSLADVLGQPIGDDPVTLRRGPPNLKVRELDSARQFEMMRERYVSTIDALFDGLTSGQSSRLHIDASQDRAVLQRLIDLAPPGIDELAAVIEVVDAADSSGRRLIVMDTAPTGHALRLLEMPALVHDWTKVVMSILLKYRSVASLEEVGPLLVKLSQGLGRLRTLLADHRRTCFVAITRAAGLPHEETLDLLRRLDGLGIRVPAIVVNAVGRGRCRQCRSEEARERPYMARLKEDTPRSAALVIAPAEMPPPRTPASLHRWQRRWYRAM